MTYRRRHVESVVEAALGDTRVVIVSGARQAGKSTVAHRLVRDRPNVVERKLDRPSDLSAARLDPTYFVDHDGLMVIDEIQRAPELMLPIKAAVDVDNRPGQFLLTGSARLLGLRGLPDALVGRSETVELWPFAQGEIDNKPDGFVDAAFAEPVAVRTAGSLAKQDYFLRALRGGFPEAVNREAPRRSRFFASYLTDLVDRDVTQLGDIQRRDSLNRLLRLLASRAASPLSVSNLATDLALNKITAERYVALFEEVFLIKRIPAWANSATTRATRTRKLLMVDSGLCAHLAGLSAQRLERDPALAGSLLENFVLTEIMRQLQWSASLAQLFHYRSKDGEEVDGVIEHIDGRIVGVEVKASSTIAVGDERHLRHLQRRAGDRFHFGVVLYTGKEIYSLGDRLIAAPIDALWESGIDT